MSLSATILCLSALAFGPDAGAPPLSREAELTQTYERVRAKHKADPRFLSKLEASQKAWLAFRAAHREARFPALEPRATYGSVYPMCVAAIDDGLIRERLAQLREWLDGVDEGEVCAGSLPRRP